MVGVSAIQQKAVGFLLNNNVRLDGLTTLVKNFDVGKIKQTKNLLLGGNKKSLLDIQLFANSGNAEQGRGIRSLFSNINSNFKGNFIDIFA